MVSRLLTLANVGEDEEEESVIADAAIFGETVKGCRSTILITVNC